MKEFLVILSFISLSISTYAQDFQFTHFWNNPQRLNPALTGDLSSDHSWSINSSNEWTPYRSIARSHQVNHQLGLSYKFRITKYDYLSVGNQSFYRNNSYRLRNDLLGNPMAPINVETALALAYHKRLNPKNDQQQQYLSLGVESSLGQLNSYWNWDLPFPTYFGNTPSSPLYYHEKKLLNFDLGMAWILKKGKSFYQAAISISNLNQSQEPFPVPNGYIAVYPPIRYAFQARIYHQLSEKWGFRTQLAFDLQKAFPREVIIDNPFAFRLPLYIGAAYSLNKNASLFYDLGLSVQERMNHQLWGVSDLVNNLGFRYKNLEIQFAYTFEFLHRRSFRRHAPSSGFVLGMSYRWG
jgi:hypothetical protein